MTYVVLVILILLWAAVLLPPYLKDRRSSSRTFGEVGNSGVGFSPSAQRFLPLEQLPSNVVRLRGSEAAAVGSHAGATTAATSPLNPDDFLGEGAFALGDGSVELPREPLADPFGAPQPKLGVPTTTAAARERRRHVLIGLTGLAFVTLLAAITVRGTFIALHIAIDTLMLGYVILLVRHRQMTVERQSKVEPIRPPVGQHAAPQLQVAPGYLIERTGS